MWLAENKLAAETLASSHPTSSSTTSQPTMETAQRVVQQENWDCGLACVSYVLQHGCGRMRSLEDLHACAPATSVWTPDLSALLLAEGVGHTFCTTFAAGANPQHAGMAFYPAFNADSCRLSRVMSSLRSDARLTLVERHVELPALLATLCRQSAWYIALLDMRHMACVRCGWAPGSPTGEYVGHYVVLTGVEGRQGGGSGGGGSGGGGGGGVDDECVVTYMDPDSRVKCTGACAMTQATLERARVEAGTDEDLLEVPLCLPLSLPLSPSPVAQAGPLLPGAA